jgi:hypothetical protein
MKPTTEHRLSELEDALLNCVRIIQSAGRAVTQHVTRDVKQKAIANALVQLDLELNRASTACQSRTMERALVAVGDDDLLAGMLLRKSRADREHGRTPHN